ncbi:hypothetical protein J1N35_023408 [Gossypium stocksii]|uniref:RNase H type-1 domain-containing protein n=1 Tax=Gossypium stocksii TaxID=47602 RepID=A0A9D4A3N4_9ROSI|nr:hypothetical protein J1N35_023408 [Gossypium stocksii]
MERLAHRITMEVQAGKWNLIHLRGEGQALSHLFFVADLVLFCQAEVSQVTLIKIFLEEFSALSSHKVNARKTQVCFSSNVEDESTDSLASLLRFQSVNDHGRYLGAPPFQKRIMRRVFHFVINKIRSRLNGWDAKLLSMDILLRIAAIRAPLNITSDDVCVWSNSASVLVRYVPRALYGRNMSQMLSYVMDSLETTNGGVNREANQLADGIAKIAHGRDITLDKHTHPAAHLWGVFLSDAMGWNS